MPLRNAAYWIHQRQDVYWCIVHQRAPKTDLGRSGLDRSTAPADECTWAKRATCLNAEVVGMIFGPDAGSVKNYVTIMRKLEAWFSNLPDTFLPAHYKEADPEAQRFFPEIYVLIDSCSE
jgi:hypothetical protein